jgi:phenylalanyl-tRNA synthetase beta chain
MIQLQEKISQTYGRNRKDVAIGIYDFDKIKPPIQYTTVKPDGIRFVPLEFKEEMTPKQILEKHPKGVAYAHLINKYPEYPILIDSAKNVLSMPPIINSDYTGKVTEDTKNVFIEATGYDTDRLLTVLNVITSALFDRGGEIYSTEIFYGDEKITTPDFSLKEFFLDINYCKKLLGIDIKNNEILKLLEKARYDASIKGDKILVKYQAYRNDIMHQNDIIEDIAIKFDYNKIEPEYPNLPTTGSEDKLEIFSNDIRTLMIGLGFQEIINYIMTSTEKQFTKMNEKPENYVEIENPVSAEYSILRTSILPNLLENLSSNKHRRFPQRIFEIGDCVVIEKDTSTKNVRKLAFVISHTNANFSEISSICNAIKENLGLNVQLKPYNIKSMIKGRCAGIYFGNELIGFFGEIHPKVLENWHLEKPVVGFEVNIDKLFEIISTS